MLKKMESKSSKQVVKKSSMEHGETSATSSGTEKMADLPNASQVKKKLKSPIVNDPYFVNATTSEKEIIKELVKADVEAMLERDAVALLPEGDEPQQPSNFAPPPPPPSKPPQTQQPLVKTTVKKAEPALHWSYRAKDVKTSVPANNVAAAAPKKLAVAKSNAKAKLPNNVATANASPSKSKRR